jgi:hypothetical protein
MLRTLRIIAGVLIIGFLLASAQLATRDCPAGLFRYDSCLWLAASEYLGLTQQSKPLRAVFLEGVGLTLLAGFYLTYRLVLSPTLKPRAGRAQTGQGAEAEPVPPQHESQVQAAELEQKDRA